MSEIRPAHLLHRTLGPAAVSALLLAAAACGGDGGDSSFCDAANEVNDTFDSIDDPATEEYSAAVDRLAELDPPSEIADDWAVMVQMLDGIAEIDVNDPEAADDLAEAESAANRVGTYLDEECGIEID